MKQIVPGIGVGASILFLAACDGAPGSNAALDSNDQKASYAIGVNMGRSLVPAASRVDLNALLRGMNDVLEENDLALEDQEMAEVLQTFSTEIQAAEGERLREEAETNLAEGTAWLQENAERDGVVTTGSGLQYEVLEEGDGPMPGPDDRARVHYRGTLTDGTEFDSSLGGDPAEFGVGGVIAGFAEGLQLMPVGSKYKLFIPSHLGYGPAGAGADIPPNSVLIFEVEMIEVVE